MLLFFMACMSTKITKMEQEIEVLQAQNAALEKRVVELEGDVKELEPPVTQMQTFLQLLLDASLFDPNFFTKDYSSEKSAAPEKTLSQSEISALRKEAPIQRITLTKQQREMLGELEILSSFHRAVPHRTPEGTIGGMRLFGIPSGSLAYQLGLKNGDILVTMNDEPMTSADQILEQYQELEKLTSIELLMLRRRKPLVLHYILDE